MRSLKPVLSFIFLITTDLLTYYICLFLAVWTRVNVAGFFFKPIPPFIFSFEYLASMWWIPVVFLGVTAFERLYFNRFSFWEEARAILKTGGLSMLFVFFLISVRHIFGDVSRLTFILLWVFICLVLPFTRSLAKRLLFRMGLWKEKVLVVGSGEDAIATARGMMKERQLGYDIVGFLDQTERSADREVDLNGKACKIYSGLEHIDRYLSMLKIETVVISIPHLDREEQSRLTNHIQKSVKSVIIVPDLAGVAQMNTEQHYLVLQKIFLLKINNNLHSGLNQFIKRVFDLTLSLLMLPFLLPVIAVIALWIRLDSKGSAFIRQERLGKNRRVFKCVKFRTMFENADSMLESYFKDHPEAEEEWKLYKKLRGYDPRVTKAGRFLRKLSLDEVPQIFNVLMGQMSLVGPRPYLPREEEEMGENADLICLSTPGITGLWQISGRNDVVFSERLKLDTWYVQNWSTWLDIIILADTVEVVLKRRGAY